MRLRPRRRRRSAEITVPSASVDAGHPLALDPQRAHAPAALHAGERAGAARRRACADRSRGRLRCPARAGSSAPARARARGACDGRSRSTGRPRSRRKAARRSSASASSRSRATTSVPDRAVARVLELGAEGREAAGALHAQLEQRALAELGLGDRRQHPGRDVPRAGLAGVDHDDPGAPLLRAPRTGEADRATTDDGDVEALGLDWHCGYGLPTPARPGSGSTVGAPMAPSQPGSGLPCSALHGIP